MTTDDQDRPQPDVTQELGAPDDPQTSPLKAINDLHTQQIAAAIDPDPHAEFRRQAAEHFKAAQPEPHTEFHRQTAQRFEDAPANPNPYGQSPPAPGSGQMHLDLRPWHAAAGGGVLCLLFALVASSSFGWIVLAALCAAAAWYLKTKNVAWPPTVRDTLIRQGLTNPAATALGAQPPRALGIGQMRSDLRPWHAAAAAGALCLLIALFAGSFAWIMLAVLCAAGAWYLKTKAVAWPSSIRDTLNPKGLTNLSTTPADARPVNAPPPGYAPRNYGGATHTPGVGAAIAAALLALALGVYWLVQTYDLWRTVAQFSGASVPGTGGLKATVIVEAVVSTATCIALLVGGAWLLNRNARGRGWIAFGCVVILADAAATWLTMFSGFRMGLATVPSVVSLRVFESMVHSQAELKTWVFIATALPLLTLILAWSKASGRWCGETTPPVRARSAVAAIGVVALVAAIAAIGTHSARRAYERAAEQAAAPTTPTTTASSAVDSTSLAIKNATVNSCIHRSSGSVLADGTSSLATFWTTSCSSSDATDVVTMVTDNTSNCGTEWAQTKAFGQPIVLCLRKM